MGYDNIQTNIIKANVNIFARILSNLINKSVAQGVFHDPRKRSKILPVYKNKDKRSVSNYRPISILPVISKVYERVLNRRLYEYFSDNNILSSSQFGFRSGASTEHALLKFTDDIQQCFDNNKIAIASIMDLSKIFDFVNHDILLTKLRRYSVNFNALQRIKSYLSVREHFVSWNQSHSHTLNLNIGIPKG